MVKSLLLVLVLLCGAPAITAAAEATDTENTAAPQLAEAEAAEPVQDTVPEGPQEENEPPLPMADDVPVPASVRGHFYGCPSGWVRYKDGCYRFEAIRRTWASAQTRCNSFRADLTSVHSQEDLFFLQRMTRQARQSAVWVGGFYFLGWRWIDNTPFNYVTSPWIAGRNLYNQCLRLNAVGSWSYQNCGNTLPYICVRRIDNC